MDEVTRITHTGETGHNGFTITTGRKVPLAQNATRDEALDAMRKRGYTPVAAVTALNAAVRIGHFTVMDLPAT